MCAYVSSVCTFSPLRTCCDCDTACQCVGVSVCVSSVLMCQLSARQVSFPLTKRAIKTAMTSARTPADVVNSRGAGTCECAGRRVKVDVCVFSALPEENEVARAMLNAQCGGVVTTRA